MKNEEFFSGEQLLPLYQKVPFCWKYDKWSEKNIFCSIGSCFADEISSALAGGGLQIEENPNGILYNPVSIADSLERLAEKRFYTAEDFFFHEGVWHSWSHHGSFSHPEREKALENANRKAEKFRNTLEKANCIFLTLSSAVVYEIKSSGKIAANCHRMVPETFERRLLSYPECKENCLRIVENIRKCNKKCVILFTLSPVRHYPGEVLLNSVSKCRLRSAMEELFSEEENIAYFPAYEIVNDSLRDYRFYKEDLVHLSPFAVKIILDLFLKNCFLPSVAEKVRLWRKKCAGECHIPRKDKNGSITS